MKTKLYSICASYNFEELFKNKGYSFFTKGFYNLNIIGVRNNKENKVTNFFDDYLILDYNTEKCHKRYVYTITTEPGLKYMLKPTNKKGTAILVPGQYKGVYSVDLHRGKYKALCQRNGIVKVYRDNNRDRIYDLAPEKIDSGMFGINIHRATEKSTCNTIDSFSAGCQVFSNPLEFNAFMRIVEKAKNIWGNKFTYTLITEDDLV